MAGTLKAIETVFDGYRFRSRLEARWATFFKTVGIRYEYEKEGFDLDGLLYLPDFWLPNVGLRGGTPGIWVEIKAVQPTASENEKCERLAIASNHPVVMMIGLPGENSYDAGYQWQWIAGHRGDSEDPFEIDAGIWWDNYMVFMRCYKCGTVKVEFSESNYCVCPYLPCHGRADEEEPLLMQGYAAARHARFEHSDRRG